MYLLFDKRYKPEKLIYYSTELIKITHMMGFINTNQYYCSQKHFLKTKHYPKKFQHINDIYKVETIDQRKFFNKNYVS